MAEQHNRPNNADKKRWVKPVRVGVGLLLFLVLTFLSGFHVIAVALFPLFIIIDICLFAYVILVTIKAINAVYVKDVNLNNLKTGCYTFAGNGSQYIMAYKLNQKNLPEEEKWQWVLILLEEEFAINIRPFSEIIRAESVLQFPNQNHVSMNIIGMYKIAKKIMQGISNNNDRAQSVITAVNGSNQHRDIGNNEVDDNEVKQPSENSFNGGGVDQNGIPKQKGRYFFEIATEIQTIVGYSVIQAGELQYIKAELKERQIDDQGDYRVLKKSVKSIICSKEFCSKFGHNVKLIRSKISPENSSNDNKKLPATALREQQDQEYWKCENNELLQQQGKSPVMGSIVAKYIQ